MDDFYRTLLASLSTFLIGSLLTLLAARITKILFGRITSRTSSDTDDFILQVLVKTIKPLGLLTAKPIIYAANLSEDDLAKGNSYSEEINLLFKPSNNTRNSRKLTGILACFSSKKKSINTRPPDQMKLLYRVLTM